MHNFSLTPFSDINSNNIAINGTITRDNNNFLSIGYQVSGELNNILLAQPSPSPMRKDELWQTTCFECFIAVESSSHYWEINLSPSQNWNIYKFTDYRDGMHIEDNFDALPFIFSKNNELLQIKINLDLNNIITNEQKINVGITAVIENQHHDISYWALQHCGKEADFHLKESFVISL